MPLQQRVIPVQHQVRQPPLPRPFRRRAHRVQREPAVRVHRQPRQRRLLRRERQRLPQPHDLRVVHIVRERGDPAQVHAARRAAAGAPALRDVLEDDARAHPAVLVERPVAVRACGCGVRLPRADGDRGVVWDGEVLRAREDGAVVDGGEAVEERKRGVGHRLDAALLHVAVREVVRERVRHRLARDEGLRVRELAQDAREEPHAPRLAVLGAEVGRRGELGADLLRVPRAGLAGDRRDDAISDFTLGSGCAFGGRLPVQESPAGGECGQLIR